MLAECMRAYLAGDCLLQSEWAPSEKSCRRRTASAAVGTLSFLLTIRSRWRLLAIGSKHAALDRYRAAKYLIWARNQLAPALCRVPRTEPAGSRSFPASLTRGRARVMIVADNTSHPVTNGAPWNGCDDRHATCRAAAGSFPRTPSACQDKRRSRDAGVPQARCRRDRPVLRAAR